jgi:DNA-binding transcriptional ArsR family regulator
MQLQPLDRMFLALADPNRRGMVEQLSNGPATVKQLATPARMRLPSAVKHLKVLEQSGIVISNKVGRTRTYRIRVAALRAITAWARNREAAWNAAFDRLAAVMREAPEETEQ